MKDKKGKVPFSGRFCLNTIFITASIFLQSGKPPVKDMFTDLKDGRKLLDLLEGLTGKPLVREMCVSHIAIY